MPLPKTLFALSGVQNEPARLDDETTLIRIDVQNEYVSGALPLHDIGDAIAEVIRVLARARAASVPVVHVRHKGRPGGLFDPESWRGDFVAGAGPRDGEVIVDKNLPDAFASSDLEKRLEEIGRRKLIFAGFMTHMCLSATVQGAIARQFQSTVIASAAATRALPTFDGNDFLPAKAVHEAALAGLADRFAAIVPDVKALGD